MRTLTLLFCLLLVGCGSGPKKGEFKGEDKPVSPAKTK